MFDLYILSFLGAPYLPKVAGEEGTSLIFNCADEGPAHGTNTTEDFRTKWDLRKYIALTSRGVLKHVDYNEIEPETPKIFQIHLYFI